MQNEFEMVNQLDPARSLALKLHALHEDDRAWMLSQLDPEARAQLAPLLEELTSLGVQVDSTDIARMTLVASRQSNASLASTSEEVQLINRASLSQIDMVFDDEPSILFQQLTALQQWSWIKEDQARHSSSNGARYAGATIKSVTTPAVKQALVKAVAMQLRKQEKLFDSHSNYVLDNSRKFDYLAKPSTTITDRLKGLLPWVR